MSETANNLLELTSPTVPLTDWENEPKVSDLKQDLQEASNHHDTHVTKVNVWLDNLNVTGSAKVAKIKGRSTIVPKLIRKQAEWRYAALSETFLSNENLFQTDPVTFEDNDSAIQNGLILNNQFNTKIDKVAFIDEYIRTSVDEGTVIVRTGWDFEEEEVEVPNMVLVPIEDPAMLQQLDQALMALQQDPAVAEQFPPELMEIISLTMDTGEPVMMVQDGMKTEMKTVKNQPTVDVCDYRSIIIDPTCKGDLRRASFAIYTFETSLSALKKDGKYINLDKINIESNSIQSVPEVSNAEDTSFNFTDEPRKKFLAYEYWGYWDINGSGVVEPFVATWVGDTMIRMEESPFPKSEGLPFTLVQYLPKRKNVYGEPDGELLEDNQKIVGAVTRGMMDTMGRAATGQKGIRKDALDVTNQRKFEAGKDYYFNAHVDPSSAFYDHTYPELPNSAQFILQLMNMDAEALTGVKAFYGGISGESLGKSATAARSALDAASKRELGILRRLAKGIVDIGRKIMAMNAIFLSEEEVIRITNEEFVTIKRDDLAGKVDIRLQISTAETDNAKAEELAFMLQTMGNTMPPEMSYIVLEDIARLRKMPELAQKIKTFQPQPDPMQEKLKELEMAKIEAEIAKLQSEAYENQAEAELDLASAKQKASQADKQDLDFVEQEDGTAHARDVDRMGAQAEANALLEAVKAKLNPKGGNS